jgi:hypothetical protein
LAKPGWPCAQACKTLPSAPDYSRAPILVKLSRRRVLVQLLGMGVTRAGRSQKVAGEDGVPAREGHDDPSAPSLSREGKVSKGELERLQPECSFADAPAAMGNGTARRSLNDELQGSQIVQRGECLYSPLYGALDKR